MSDSVQNLPTTINAIDKLSQEAFATTSAAAGGPLRRLENQPGGLAVDEYLATTLEAILFAAGDAWNEVNVMAESAGCNWVQADRRERVTSASALM